MSILLFEFLKSMDLFKIKIYNPLTIVYKFDFFNIQTNKISYKNFLIIYIKYL